MPPEHEVWEVDPIWKKLEKYPNWIRDYIHEVSAYDGAEEVKEIFFFARSKPGTHQAGERTQNREPQAGQTARKAQREAVR